MSRKIQVGILMGGKSAEHQISLLSAKSVVNALYPDKYTITLIGIHQTGEWFAYDSLEACLEHPDDPKHICLKPSTNPVVLLPSEKGALLTSLSGQKTIRLDVIFPVLHGPNGEDGTMQGLLKLANIAFVGPSILGSAVAMDKDVMKRLFKQAGIPTAAFKVVHAHEHAAKPYTFEEIEKTLGLPFFIKPANLGSSVGISKVKSKSEFKKNLDFAFQFDTKVIIEEQIVGRELECSVLGNESPEASLPGEVIPQHEFYSYEAKYLDPNGALFEIPASLHGDEITRIQLLAIEAYKTLCCEGMARVDLFLEPGGRILLNEINTIPGFTKISMYPKMWDASGLRYPDLIDRLITLAIARFKREQALKTNLELQVDDMATSS
ncbi:MAG: D-alanine--D-alanine ligase [Gammaproteobacteria bacterium]